MNEQGLAKGAVTSVLCTMFEDEENILKAETLFYTRGTAMLLCISIAAHSHCKLTPMILCPIQNRALHTHILHNTPSVPCDQDRISDLRSRRS